MAFQGADADTYQQHQEHHGCSGGQRQRGGERGGAPGGGYRRYPPARQRPCILSPTIGKIQNVDRGAGDHFATLNVEDTLANMWALDDVGAALGGGRGSPPLPTLLCRTTDEVLLEIQRDQRHLMLRQNSENAQCQPSFGAVSPEISMKSEIAREGVLGPSSSETQPLNQHLLLQQQQQSQFENGIPSFELASEQRGNAHIIGLAKGNYHDVRTTNDTYQQPGFYDQQPQGVDVLLATNGSDNGGKASSNYFSRGLHGRAGMPSGETGAAGSPKGSTSSDGSGGDSVGNSPAAVWEVGMRGGAGKEGGAGSAGGGGGKRSLDAADEDVVGLRQPQMIRASESLARVRDRELSIDGLKQLFLLYANMELPTSAGEAMKEIDDNVKQLLQLLRATSLERDEARDQLQRLLNKTAQPTPLGQSPVPLHPDLLFTGRTRISTGVAAFDTLFQDHNYHPYALSPVETLFESSSSPTLPNGSMADSTGTALPQQPPLPECSSSTPPGVLRAQAVEFDPASAIIDRLVAKKALPERGKLLQAVMEAGPLLQTLLVAGPLPQWRNPPPLQPFQVPPVSVRGRESSVLDQTAAMDQNYLVQRAPPPPDVFHHQNSLVASQVCAASSMGCSSGLSGFSSLRGTMPSTCASSYQGSLGKRQRF